MNEADMLNIRIGFEGGFDFTWVNGRAPLVLHRVARSRRQQL